MKIGIGNFLAKFSILSYVYSINIGYFEVGYICDVIVASYVDCFYLF